MKETKILGNQEGKKGIEKLLRQAGQDKLINGVIKGKEIPEYNSERADFFKQFKNCEKAKKLILAINQYGEFNYKEGLFQHKNDGSFYYTFDNISMALACLAMGHKKEADDVIRHLHSVNGFYGSDGLINNRSKHAGWTILDNSLLILAYLGVDKREKASSLYRALSRNSHKHVLYGDKAITKEKDSILVETGDNAAYALASYALGYEGEAESIIEYIDEGARSSQVNISRYLKSSLYESSTVDDDVFIAGNALMALAKMAVKDDLEEASKIIQHIEKLIGFDKETGLVNHSTEENYNSYSRIADSALLTLAYMMQEFYKTK